MPEVSPSTAFAPSGTPVRTTCKFGGGPKAAVQVFASSSTTMAKKVGRRKQRGADKGTVRQSITRADPRHKSAIVKSLTETLLAIAADANVSEEDIAKRATVHLHATCPAAAKVATKTVLAHLQKMRMHGNVEDAPRSGRPPALTTAQLNAAIRHFEGGFHVSPPDHPERQLWFGFTSFPHALLEVCPNSEKLRKLVADSGLTLRGFWDAMCRHKPNGFNKVCIEVKKTLPADVLKERERMSKKWAKRTEEELDHTVFCDEKAMWLCGAQTYTCYAPDGMKDQVRTGLVDIRDSYKLKFIAAVNSLLGGIYMEQISGSMDYDTPWMVRTPVFQCLLTSATAVLRRCHAARTMERKLFASLQHTRTTQ